MFRQGNVAFFICLNICFMCTNFTSIALDNSYYEQFCPYSNFCTQNATKIKTSAEVNLTSCCHECSCDSDCQKFGNCCPDFNVFSRTQVKYPCVDLTKYFNVLRGLAPMTIQFDVAFHIIDDCELTEASNYSSCLMLAELEDFIVVTDKANGRIYKNKHCAYCHGVQDYEEWDIITDCKGLNEIRFETFEKRNIYMVNHCAIVPFPKKSQMTSKYRCILPEDIKDRECFTNHNEVTSNGLDNENVENIRSACEFINPYVNDMFYVDKWYANIYCYLCDERYNISSSYLCEVQTFLSQDNVTDVKLTMTISHKSPEHIKQVERCDMSSIWDSYSNSCLKLYCPAGSIPEFGKCRSVTVSSTAIAVTAAFRLEQIGNTEMNLDFVNNFHSTLTAKLEKIQSCGKCSSVLASNNLGTFLFYRLFTLDECNRNYLLSRMEKAFKYSMTLSFNHSNETIIAKPTMTTFLNNVWNSKVYSSFKSGSLCAQTEIYVFDNCARIDTRTVPLFADNESLSKFDGSVIDHKVCVRDYYRFIESLSNVSPSVIHTLSLFVYYFVWLLTYLLFEVSQRPMVW